MTSAQSYLMVLASNRSAAFVRDVRQAGDATPVCGMSYVGAAGVVAKAPSRSATGVRSRGGDAELGGRRYGPDPRLR